MGGEIEKKVEGRGGLRWKKTRVYFSECHERKLIILELNKTKTDER